ncbi:MULTISPECIES: ion transporter [unclassified Aureispira]|uniref:ion transporter n=1 Tax=unclassified Aureispira TaxID=2649989 RepID=UPI000695AB8C|nr:MULTISPECIES: ion transporter [unclassified Aureispira]WMX15221.1 ion transporter [Aureispira sp. CCB-E]
MSTLDSPTRLKARNIINSTWFNMTILGLIVLNGLLIGVQTYSHVPSYIQVVQLCILFVFFIEVVLRWHGRRSTREYFADRWNWFDVFILVIGIIPEVAGILFTDMNDQQNSVFATLRVLRIVQLTRSIRAIEELRVLIGVLLKSIKSLSYIAVLFLLIMYIYAIMGVTLFKNKQYSQSEHLELTISNPDPYGSLGEAFFTLFRILTGEDWTDLRYNLLKNEYTAKEDGMNTVPAASNWVVTIYHVSWMVIAAYLLVNLVVGAIVNNFQLVLDARREEEERFKNKKDNQNPAINNPDDGRDDDKLPPRRTTKRPKV